MKARRVCGNATAACRAMFCDQPCQPLKRRFERNHLSATAAFLSITLGASPNIIGIIEGAAESVSSLLKLFRDTSAIDSASAKASSFSVTVWRVSRVLFSALRRVGIRCSPFA
jgi:hypothetical protein